MDNAVKFRQKTLDEYILLTPDANTIYFISDAGRIYLGSTLLSTINDIEGVIVNNIMFSTINDI